MYRCTNASKHTHVCTCTCVRHAQKKLDTLEEELKNYLEDQKKKELIVLDDVIGGSRATRSMTTLTSRCVHYPPDPNMVSVALRVNAKGADDDSAWVPDTAVLVGADVPVLRKEGDFALVQAENGNQGFVLCQTFQASLFV
jgi:hypothetical protein